jgi:hypothetical protein
MDETADYMYRRLGARVANAVNRARAVTPRVEAEVSCCLEEMAHLLEATRAPAEVRSGFAWWLGTVRTAIDELKPDIHRWYEAEVADSDRYREHLAALGRNTPPDVVRFYGSVRGRSDRYRKTLAALGHKPAR